MSRLSVLTIAAALTLSVTLAAGPTFVSTWKAPEAASVSVAGKKVATLIISDDQSIKDIVQATVKEMQKQGLARQAGK